MQFLKMVVPELSVNPQRYMLEQFISIKVTDPLPEFHSNRVRLQLFFNNF